MHTDPEPFRPARSLEQIVDSLPELIAYWDKNLICRYANRAYQHWFGHPAQTIVGIRMRDLLGGSLFDSNKAVIEGILRGEPQAFVRPLARLEDPSTQVHVKYIPDFDADNEVAGFYVSVYDVTDFRRIEVQLRQKEAELTALIARRDDAISWLEIAEEIAHVGHWRVSLPTGALTWSDEMYRIHGVTMESFKPNFIGSLAFYCPEDRVRIRALTQRVLTEGLPYEDTGQIVRRDGEVRHVRIRGMARLGPDGLPVTAFGVVVDVTDQRKTEHALRIANERLEAIVLIDALTGISNRRRFDEAFDVEWRAAARNGSALSVLLIDVDRFKAFNDTYGHQSGDECLKAVAGALQSVIRRPHDIVARYGGEEFVILLPATDRAGARLVAEQARAAVEDLGRTHEGTVSGVVTISIGVGSLGRIGSNCGGSRALHTPGELIAEADQLLYRAKKLGQEPCRVDTRGSGSVRDGIKGDDRSSRLWKPRLTVSRVPHASVLPGAHASLVTSTASAWRQAGRCVSGQRRRRPAPRG